MQMPHRPQTEDSRSTATIEANECNFVERALCTLCAKLESPGFYTGCMIEDGYDGNGWCCDGNGNLTHEKPRSVHNDRRV